MKKRYSTIVLLVIVLVAVFTINPVTAAAQTLDENGYMDMPEEGEEIDFTGPGDYMQLLNQVENTGPDDPGVDPATPVDGGLSILLAAGLGYGANRIRKNRMEKRKAE